MSPEACGKRPVRYTTSLAITLGASSITITNQKAQHLTNKMRVKGEKQTLIGPRALESGNQNYKPASVNTSCLPKKKK
jgi:hypothetical protein